MKYKLLILLNLFCFALPLLSQAQVQDNTSPEILTLEDAVKIALEKNYEIKIAANNVDIDENNVNRANAGMLPALTGNLSNNNTVQNSSQTRADGETTTRAGAQGSNLNYGVGLSWTIFDGFGMFARYDQLQELEKLSRANMQLTILTRVSDVINFYYALVSQQQQLKANKAAIEISRYRVNTAQNRFTIGKAARLEVLNAQVDLNTDTTNYLRQVELYQNTQTQLNELLARDVATRFRVMDTVIIDNGLVLADLSDRALKQNPALQAAAISRRIAELDYKQVKANRYPAITVNSGYNFSRNQSALGFATLTTGRGFSYGLAASVNIFNGFLQRRNEQNANTLVENAQLQLDQVQQSLKSQLTSAYQTYQTNLALVKQEESNQELAKRNLDITLDKYRLGSIAPIEFRDAQLNYINARLRLSNAQNQAKLAEIGLREIAGNLIL